MHVEYNGEVEPRIMEADKCENLMWVSPDKPRASFEASRNAVDLWLTQRFYHHKPNQCKRTNILFLYVYHPSL